MSVWRLRSYVNVHGQYHGEKGVPISALDAVDWLRGVSEVVKTGCLAVSENAFSKLASINGRKAAVSPSVLREARRAYVLLLFLFI